MKRALGELRELLITGIRYSMQGSLGRRAPSSKSIPYVVEAREGLKRYVDDSSNDVEAWELLSRAEECLLNYKQAIQCLEKAMSLSGKRDKRSLKRLALLRESLNEWSALPLTPQQLSRLGEFLTLNGALEERYGRTLDITKQWMQLEGFTEPDAILNALANRGGYTDFQILYNVCRG